MLLTYRISWRLIACASADVRKYLGASCNLFIFLIKEFIIK